MLINTKLSYMNCNECREFIMFSVSTPRSQLNTQLRALGADGYDVRVPETKYLLSVLLPGEDIIGVVYGRYTFHEGTKKIIGRGMLVATGRRILLLDKKPFYSRHDELSYYVVSGIDYNHVGPAGTVTLQSRVANIDIRTFNDRCARNFCQAIESKMLGLKRYRDDIT
jgi:hypothetical protein